MWVLLLSLLHAAVIQNSGADLRSSCEPGATVVTTLPAGTPVTIRYALSGQAVPCYRVAVELDGRTVEGYLPPQAMASTEAFDSARRQAGWIGTREVMETVVQPQVLAAPAEGTTVIATASDLIQSSRPVEALQLLEAELKTRRDPNLLAMAGAAAWRADDPRKALDYWRASLKMQPNPGLQELYTRVENEANSDRSAYRLYGVKVLLRYEGAAVSAEAAREMMAAVDVEFARVSEQLGCTTGERIVVIAQSPDAYRKTTNAAEWSGGQYDGRIRVPVFERGQLDSKLRRTLAHETTHACLSMMGRWPAWLQEGVAQYMSGSRTTAADRSLIAELARQSKLPKLSTLGQDWSGLDTASARIAYTQALAAVETFQDKFAEYGLRNLLRNPDRLPAITADLDRVLAEK